MLAEHIPIPAEAWWRDDLDRRLDDAWDLKFAYPALFTGPDLLRLVIESSPNEGRERRSHAVKAFLAHQYDSDREVKFKQAEIENDIFDLFTDVPLVPPIRAGRKRGTMERLAAAFGGSASSVSGEVDSIRLHHWFEMVSRLNSTEDRYYRRDDVWLNTASLLLNSDFQLAEPLVILEGGPGQGKSTIAQYICQVHRLRILDHPTRENVDTLHLDSPLRIPFKVELRDFATWLSGGNPFGTSAGGGQPDTSPKSLEGFLSALIRFASGGSLFDVSDLQSMLASSPVLIVLDGLDEVAESSQRQRVVEEITSAVPRMNSNATSLQVVVTTRPTPFTNSTALPKSTFATYALGSLNRPLITAYADRWLRSRKMNESDANEVRKILEQKLDEPHLRALARNPMQLAILLNLIHRRGVSLPDKRTALYDNYVTMFFDREAEKAPVVQENRDLLVRIHRYLAWVLQSGAEVEAKSKHPMRDANSSLSGTISDEDLKSLIREFLETDGSDPDLADLLFGGMVERVVAIVSRVQGLYEFDVQTLREYFAARYLYETAPYSPPGNERRGTISDRWAALSRNFYWLNVARFYAGCYSEGELASLIDDLGALKNDDVFRWTHHPQLLTATLLGDWVFSQRPRAVDDAVDLLLEPRGLHMFISEAGFGSHRVDDIAVGDPKGKRRIADGIKALVTPDRPIEQIADIVQAVLRPNSDPGDLLEWWTSEMRSADDGHASWWCLVGELLQCWSEIPAATVAELLSSEGVPSPSVIAGLLHACRMDILESNEEIFDAAVDAVLAGEWVGSSPDDSVLQRLAGSINPWLLSGYGVRYLVDGGGPLREYPLGFHDPAEDITWPSYLVADRCRRLVEAFASEAERPLEEWERSIGPWESLVQQGVDDLGMRTRFLEVANVAAGVGSKEDKAVDSPQLFDTQRPLVRRARYARLRAGSQKWWSRQLDCASTPDEVRFALLVFVTYAGARTIEQLVERVDRLIVNLTPSEWAELHSSVRVAVEINSGRPWIKPLGIRVADLPSSVSVRTVSLLSERCTQANVDRLYARYLADYNGNDSIIFELRADVDVRHATRDKSKWPQAIETIKSHYGKGAPLRRVLLLLRARNLVLPEAIARAVVDEPLEYPSALVRIAEARCRHLDAAKIRPVGQVAADDGWFTH